MFKIFIKNAISGDAISLWGKGAGRREYIYVKDVATALSRSVLEVNQSGVFNIGTGKNHSHLELAQTIIKATNSASKITFDETKQEDIYCDQMICDKAKQLLGWSSKYDLKEALSDIVKNKI